MGRYGIVVRRASDDSEHISSLCSTAKLLVESMVIRDID